MIDEWFVTVAPTIISGVMTILRGGPLPEPPLIEGRGIHLPPPSYWPLVTALGVSGIFVVSFGTSACRRTISLASITVSAFE